MSQEIIYTSAPQGLKPGSRGFCTVVSTNGMARNLAERLEGLSGYRHRFEPHDPNAHLNPVNYSHLLLTVGGTKFHVLSQIRDAGLDYTQRSNKLAHHVAFADSEISITPGSSPAWTMKADGFCEQTWDGQTKTVAAGRKKLPRESYPGGPCRAWEAVTGDAGWAAVLAESAKEQKPMHVLFPPGTDTLSLVVEALHLLPPEKRWAVTFSTYFTKLPAGTQCQWRFILDGTPEAIAVRRDPHNLTIDLCANLGPAPDGELATAARTGKPAYTVAPPPKLQPRRPTLPPVAASSPARAAEPDEATSATYDLSTTTTAPPQRAPLPRIEPLRTSKLPWILVGCLALLLFIAVGVIGVFAIKDYGGLAAAPDTGDPIVAQNSPNPKEQLDRTATQSVEEERSQKPTHDDSEEPVDPPTAKPTDDGSHGDNETASTDEPPPEPEEQHAPLHDVIIEHGSRLILPPSNPENSEDRSQQLAMIYVDDPTDVQLELIGWEKVLEKGNEYRCEPKDERGGVRRWQIAEVAPRIGQPVAIGEFVLDGQRLSFEWERTSRSKLQYCLLKIHVDSVQEGQENDAICALVNPRHQDSISLAFEHKSYPVDLNTENSLPSPESMELTLDIHGIPDERWELSEATLQPGESTTLSFIDPFDEPGTLLLVEITFNADGTSHPQLKFKNSAQPLLLFEDEADSITVGNRTITVPGPIEIRRGAEMPFSRSEFADVREQTESKVALFNRDLTALPGAIRDLMNTIRQMRAQVAELEKDKEKNEMVIGQTRRLIELCQGLLGDANARKDDEYPQAIAYCEGREEWLNKLEGFYEELETSLKIDFELYIDIGEHRVPILQTGGTEEPSGSERSSVLRIQSLMP